MSKNKMNKNKVILVSLIALFFMIGQAHAVTVYIAGDSTVRSGITQNKKPTITEGGQKNSNTDKNKLQGWGDYLAESFNDDVTVNNYAVSGQSTKSFRDKGYWDGLIQNVKAGDYVLIQFGHNDEKSSNPSLYATAGDASNNYSGTYKENLKKYAAEIAAKGGTPIIASSVERARFKDGVLRDSHGNYPAAARQAAIEAGVTFVDNTAISKNWMQQAGAAAMKDYFPAINMDGDSYKDGDATHTNYLGAQTNANAVINALKSSSNPIKNIIGNAPTSDNPVPPSGEPGEQPLPAGENPPANDIPAEECTFE